MINKTIYFLELYAPFVLRIGMAVVILWFGLQQFLHNSAWVAYIPDSIVSMSHISATNLVFMNSIFELVFGLLLIFGIQTRLSALLLGLHMFDIMWVVGYGETGVRDLGLAIGTFVVFMNGPDVFCIQQNKKAVAVITESVVQQSISQSVQQPVLQPIQQPVFQTMQQVDTTNRSIPQQ